jgi:hypothetical protein
MPTTKPIVVRKLGVGGVNLCKAPLKMDDNEVVSAQNAEPYADRGRTGIRKRPALRPINTVATDPIQGVLSVELAQGGAGAPTPVAGYHPPGITSPGPGNPDGDDDWPDPSTDDAPPFIPPTDIPPGPMVLVALNGYPRNAAWKYTQDDGATWVKTQALTNPIASDDVEPAPPLDWTPFALTIQTPLVSVMNTVNITTTPITLSGFELIPNLGGTYIVQFDFLATLVYGLPGGHSGGGFYIWDQATAFIAADLETRATNATYGPSGFSAPHNTLPAMTWAEMQTFQAAMVFSALQASINGMDITVHTITITNAEWRQP